MIDELMNIIHEETGLLEDIECRQRIARVVEEREAELVQAQDAVVAAHKEIADLRKRLENTEKFGPHEGVVTRRHYTHLGLMRDGSVEPGGYQEVMPIKVPGELPFDQPPLTDPHQAVAEAVAKNPRTYPDLDPWPRPNMGRTIETTEAWPGQFAGIPGTPAQTVSFANTHEAQVAFANTHEAQVAFEKGEITKGTLEACKAFFADSPALCKKCGFPRWGCGCIAFTP